ncbi:MAG: right-handed parallel beta-helix repeat-containing protein, partial [Phycisphaerales bacterium]
MSRNAVHRLMLVAVLLAASSAHAAIINVPGDEPTIQAGINAAMNGDEVIVAQGEYFENINFFGKAITVRSTDPNNAGVVMATIINGGGSGSVVTCDSSEGSDTVLSGFVITNGNASIGGGMYNLFSSPTVTNCNFSGNTAGGPGGGMHNTGGNPNVTNSTFSGNSAVGGSGGGMYNNGNNNPTVTNCTFTGNTSLFDGGGMGNQNGSSPTVTNCTFSGNS